MVIVVHLHTILQRQTPEGRLSRLQVDLPSGDRLADLLTRLQVELGSDDLLLLVNGRLAEEDQSLRDGDVVHLIPAISGGSDPSIQIFQVLTTPLDPTS